LIHQSKSLFSIAKNRSEKISADLIKIKRLGLPINNLQSLLDKAKNNLYQANALNIYAHDEFLSNMNTTSTSPNLASVNSVRINLQKSLINIKNAYQLFFKMNDIVKVLIK
jgi:hypothetical protein